MTAQEEYAALFERMYVICNEQNWGDPFNYARSREIHMANRLGHQIATTLSGADAIDEDGECEYKSTTQNKLIATYNGISVQPTWEEQIAYLRNEKIGKYKNHYCARYEGATIVEVYKLTAEKVLDFLIPGLEKEYIKAKNGTKKDPRLGKQIPSAYIREHGTRVVLNQSSP